MIFPILGFVSASSGVSDVTFILYQLMHLLLLVFGSESCSTRAVIEL